MPNGYELVAEYYDQAVSGADPATERKGFMAMLEYIASNGARAIIVESPDRFIAAQEAEIAELKKWQQEHGM